MSMLISGEYTPINPYTAPAGFNKGPSMLSVVRTCNKAHIGCSEGAQQVQPQECRMGGTSVPYVVVETKYRE